MAVQSMNAVVFYVSDIEATERFYRRLEFSVRLASKGHLRIAMGSLELEFHDERDERIPEFIEEARRRPKGAGLYFYFKNDQLETYHKMLVEAGVAATEIKERPWGNREFTVEDPDGFKLVFYRRIR
jgi:catechol 2,3-dioxygenase-like lactoylglutathione lyase family enzyme